MTEATNMNETNGDVENITSTMTLCSSLSMDMPFVKCNTNTPINSVGDVVEQLTPVATKAINNAQDTNQINTQSADEGLDVVDAVTVMPLGQSKNGITTNMMPNILKDTSLSNLIDSESTSIQVQKSSAVTPKPLTTYQNNESSAATSNASTSTKPSPPVCIMHCCDPDGCVTLSDILKCFNAAVSEEQAWALIYQSVRLYRDALHSFGVNGDSNGNKQHAIDIPRLQLPIAPRNLNIHKDGSVHVSFSIQGK